MIHLPREYITADHLGYSVMVYLHDKTYGTIAEAQEAFETVMHEALVLLRKESIRAGFKNAQEYAKGWRLSHTRRGLVIHNVSKYRIAHLLEKGHEIPHAKRGGGRARAFPHIERVYEELDPLIDREIIKIGKKR